MKTALIVTAAVAYYSYIAWLLHAVIAHQLPARVQNNMAPLEVK